MRVVARTVLKSHYSAAMKAIAGSGANGFSGDGGIAVNAALSTPTHIDVNDLNEIVFSDSLNHRIRRISRNGTITTIAGNGKAQFTGDGINALQLSLNSPSSVFLTNDNEIFIADSGNNPHWNMLLHVT